MATLLAVVVTLLAVVATLLSVAARGASGVGGRTDVRLAHFALRLFVLATQDLRLLLDAVRRSLCLVLFQVSIAARRCWSICAARSSVRGCRYACATAST